MGWKSLSSVRLALEWLGTLEQFNDSSNCTTGIIRLDNCRGHWSQRLSEGKGRNKISTFEYILQALEHGNSHCPALHFAYTSPSALRGQLSLWHAREQQKGFRKLASASVPCHRCASERQKFRPVHAGLWQRQIAAASRNRPASMK